MKPIIHVDVLKNNLFSAFETSFPEPNQEVLVPFILKVQADVAKSSTGGDHVLFWCDTGLNNHGIKRKCEASSLPDCTSVNIQYLVTLICAVS